MVNKEAALTTTQIVSKLGDKYGVSFIFAVAMGWVMLTYWIAPQADLIKAMTESNTKMSETFEALTQGMIKNQLQLKNIAESTAATKSSMDNASKLMADVPNMREQELTLMQQQSELLQGFCEGVNKDHQTQNEDHQTIIEKIDNG